MPTRDADARVTEIWQIAWATDAARNVFKRRQLPLTEMPGRDDVLNVAYRYWQSKRNGDLLPSRGDIDILEIARLIEHTHLVDIRDPDPDNWSFILLGSIVPETWGWGIGRGDKLSDCPWPQYKDMVVQDYSAVKSSGEPIYHEIAMRVDRIAYPYARILLPFSENGRSVETLMSCVVHRAIPDLPV